MRAYIIYVDGQGVCGSCAEPCGAGGELPKEQVQPGSGPDLEEAGER